MEPPSPRSPGSKKQAKNNSILSQLFQKITPRFTHLLRLLHPFSSKRQNTSPLAPCVPAKDATERPSALNTSAAPPTSILLQITPLATSLFLLVHTSTYSLELVTSPHPLLTTFPLRTLPHASLQVLANSIHSDLSHILSHPFPHELLAQPSNHCLQLLSNATHQAAPCPCKSPISISSITELTPKQIYRALLLGC